MNTFSVQRFKDVVITQQYKQWRTDIDRWETKYLLCGTIPIYEYSLWINGVVIIERTLFKKRGAKYFYPKFINRIYVTNKEFKENYNSNKWIIPTNKYTNEETFNEDTVSL